MTETREQEAQRLVDEGRVCLLFRGNSYVRASVEGAKYLRDTILYPSGTFWCDCSWGSSNSYTTDLCAHALAVKLAVEKENKP